MNQRSPLLLYRQPCLTNESRTAKRVFYNFQTGLWMNQGSEPIIKKMINGEINEVFGRTLETRTREGIDRSEKSNEQSDLLFQSVLTFTRESIDRSERTK
jgi:hypothetical protein